MFLSVRRCAEFMTRLPRIKVKVTSQDHVIYPSICVRSMSPESFERFSLNFTQMFLSVIRCAEPMTRLHKLKVKVTLQSHGIYPSIHVRFISPELFERFSLNFIQMFLSVRWCAKPMTQQRRLKVKVTPQGHRTYL